MNLVTIFFLCLTAKALQPKWILLYYQMSLVGQIKILELFQQRRLNWRDLDFANENLQ